MSEPEIDKEDGHAPDFNFLGDPLQKRSQRPGAYKNTLSARKPVIRTPVPVSESGPLRAPVSEADFVLTPAYTTDGLRVDPSSGGGMRDLAVVAARERHVSESLGNQNAKDRHISDSPSAKAPPLARETPAEDVRSNVTPLRNRHKNDQGLQGQHAADGRRPRFSEIDDDFAFLAEDRARPPASGVYRPTASVVQSDVSDDLFDGVHQFDDERDTGSRWLWPVAILGALIIAAGIGLYYREYLSPVPGSSDIASASSEPLAEPVAQADSVASAASSLAERFRSELAQVEELIANGALDDAEIRLATMDRTLFGYGNAEFTAALERIEQLRAAPAGANGSTNTEQERADNEATELARLEAERVAAEREAAEAERLEAERLEAERVEAERVAAEREAAEAARLEAQREAAARAAAQREAAEAARLEAARVTAEREAAEAARLEAQRETAARVAAERQATEAARLESQRQAASAARREAAEAERAATNLRIAEERAAQQREAARQRAVQQREAARQREAQQVVPVISPGAVRSINDEDVRTVSERFSRLESAIESRSIVELIGLTEPSGLRIQQFLQMFENSESISARITGLSTRNVSGSITGTLKIDRVIRADGVVLPPPPELSSITLTSRWQDGDWSVIDW